MGDFNLKEARLEEERCFRNHDLEGLAEINIKFCEALGGFDDRLPKICFYLARLGQFERLEQFLKKHQLIITMQVDYDLQRIASRCIKYGQEYKFLSPLSRLEITDLLQSPKYSELFLEMMFDYEKHLGKVDNLGIEKLRIRHTEFPSDLVEKVSRVIANGHQGVHYYDRNSNSVCELESYSRSVRGIHFIIELHIRMDETVKLILSSLGGYSDELYRDCLARMIDDVEMANMYGINEEDLVETIHYAASRIYGNHSSETVNSVLNVIAVDFLKWVNQLPEYSYLLRGQ